MKEELFKKTMIYLGRLYGKIPDDLYKILWDFLKGYPEDVFNKMVENIVGSFVPTSQVPFPFPAHFVKSVGADPKDVSTTAVSIVRNTARRIGNWHSVSFGDPALHSVIERFGGWIRICEWSDQDWNFNESKFIRAYESELKHGFNNGPDKLIGVFETHNTENYDRFTEKQKEFADRANEVFEIEWVGNKLIGSQVEERKLLGSE